MKIRWNDVQTYPNDVSEPDGRRCKCGEIMPHEYLEIYDAEGQTIEVQRVVSHGQMIRVWIDALVPVSKVSN